MSKGSRNHNLFILVSSFSDYGISETECNRFCSQFVAPDFTQNEIDLVIRSAYNKCKSNFGMKYFEDNESLEYVKKEIERDARMQSNPNYDAPPVEVNAPPTRSELIMLRAFLDDTATAYKAVIDADFDMNLIENFYVSSVIRHCIRKYEDHGENESAGAIIEAYRDDKNITDLVTTVLTSKNRLSTEWENYSDNTQERVAVTVRHATAIITAEVYTKKREELKAELASPNADFEKILADISEYSRKITSLKALTTTY